MSHAATNWAIKQRGLKPGAKILLWHLADCHNPSMGCFPSQEYLAYHSEMSRSTVNASLKILEEKGLILRKSMRDEVTQKQISTRYFLGFEDWGSESENRTRDELQAVSEKHPKPCPKNAQSRVRNSDTIDVIEPVKEPLSSASANENGAEAPERENSISDEEEKGRVKKREVSFKRFAPNWPKWLSSSEDAARKIWFDVLTDEECEQAEELWKVYVDAVLASGNTKAGICSLQIYLKEKRWTRVDAPKSEVAASTLLKPFGKGWFAYRLHLLSKPRRGWKPTAMQQKMIDAGSGDLVIPDKRRAEFPEVYSMDESSLQGRSLYSPAGYEHPDTDGYSKIKHGSDEWNAWQSWFDAMDYIPLPDPKGSDRYVWVPTMLPPKIDEVVEDGSL